VSPEAVERRTIRRRARLEGAGLFTGASTSVEFVPRDTGDVPGITVVRTDLSGVPRVRVTPGAVAPSAGDAVSAALAGRRTSLRLGPGRDARVETVEHVLSAAAGLGITDLDIEVAGPEIPILDGSAEPFSRALLDAGLQPLPGGVGVLAPREPIEVRDESGGSIVASPRAEPGLAVEYHLDYGAAAPALRGSVAFVTGDPREYLASIAPARTFCLEHEARAFRAAGLFPGLTPRDVLVLTADGRAVENTLRFPDEPARHKLLDLLGDLALAGAPIRARVVARRSGHALNRELARRLGAMGHSSA